MARIKFGSIVTEGRGSLGGHTFQNSRGGSQLRTKPIPRNNPTAAQQLIRSYNPKLQAGWRALTDAQRDIWSRFAITHGINMRLDPDRPISGHSLFMKYNFEYISRGFDLIESPYLMGPPYAGPELLLNHDFTSNSYWNFGATVQWTGSTALYTAASSVAFQQVTPLISGVNYRFSFKILNSDGSVRFYVQGSSTSDLFPSAPVFPFILGDGVYSYDTQASDDSTFLRFSLQSTGGSFEFDYVSLRRLYS
jgi:hypothetical protein